MSEIDLIYTSPSYLNSEQEIGDGYFKLTNCSFDKYTGYYQMEGEILDESHHTIGNLTVDGFPLYAYQDDHKVNIEYGIKLNLEGNIEKISSLKNI